MHWRIINECWSLSMCRKRNLLLRVKTNSSKFFFKEFRTQFEGKEIDEKGLHTQIGPCDLWQFYNLDFKF